MLKKLMLLFAISFSLNMMAQKPTIEFEVKSYDFGKINEADGKVSFTFNFTNKGGSPLVINRVQASCGCTTPDWTKAPVEPGKKGNVTAIYNPEGRPGVFTKTITVYCNASDDPVVLSIKGEVIPRTASVSNPYPVSMGDLAAKQRVIQMNNVVKGTVQTRTLEIQNNGKSNIKPVVENLPTYVSVKVTPETLKPKEEGKITFTFNSKGAQQWGPFTEPVYVVLNGQRKYSDDFLVKIVGNVVEDFSKLTVDQKRKAPILEVKSTNIDLGTIKLGAKKNGKYVLSNKGVNTLEIRRIVNQNRELAIHASKHSIANGQSGTIVAEVNSKNLSAGDYKKSFTIQTNDPDKSFMIYVVQWKVVK